MGNTLIVFEQATAWLLLGAVVSLLIAAVPYFRVSYPWSKSFSVFLATLRFLGVFIIFILLLNPLLRQLKNRTEKPTIAVIYDNSESIKLMMDSTELSQLRGSISQLKNILEQEDVLLDFNDLDQNLDQDNLLLENESGTTNLSSSLRRISENYQGKNLAASLLITDGIYNLGVSPTYYEFSKPVFTLGLGDTIPSRDISIKSVNSNAVAYQGNQFPVEVVIEQEGYEGREKVITIGLRGEVLERRNFTDEAKLNFVLDAEEAGLARYSIRIAPLEGETSTANNSSDFYVDVIEGKERILIASPAPHPDISAIRRALNASENYQTEIFIPGVSKEPPRGEFDVIIEHGSFSNNFPQWEVEGNPARWYILTPSSILPESDRLTGWTIVAEGNQRDNVRASFNPVFSSFELEQEEIDIFNRFTPISVPFGTYDPIGPVQTLIYQQIGSVVTSRPLLAVQNDGASKSAILMGPGIWQWRMLEATENGSSRYFDEIINKLIQFLSVKADKRKFRFQPVKSSFAENENVKFEAELYNDIYEPVYNQKVEVVITHESGSTQSFEYFPNAGDGGLNAGTLETGVFQFQASTSYGGKRYSATGEFSVKKINLESLNLTANHDLLQDMSKSTGGQYFHFSETDALIAAIRELRPPGIIRTSENFLPLIESLWLLLAAVVLFTAEWFLRKYLGSY